MEKRIEYEIWYKEIGEYLLKEPVAIILRNERAFIFCQEAIRVYYDSNRAYIIRIMNDHIVVSLVGDSLWNTEKVSISTDGLIGICKYFAINYAMPRKLTVRWVDD